MAALLKFNVFEKTGYNFLSKTMLPYLIQVLGASMALRH